MEGLTMLIILFIMCIVNILAFAYIYFLWYRLRNATIVGLTQSLNIINESCKSNTTMFSHLLDLCKSLSETCKLLDQRLRILEKNNKSGLSIGDILDSN